MHWCIGVIFTPIEERRRPWRNCTSLTVSEPSAAAAASSSESSLVVAVPGTIAVGEATSPGAEAALGTGDIGLGLIGGDSTGGLGLIGGLSPTGLSPSSSMSEASDATPEHGVQS